MELDFSLPSARAIRELKQIISWRGKPQVIRCVDGPEYISSAIQNWESEWGIRLEYLQPGNPQHNAYVEHFNKTVRYEWLSLPRQLCAKARPWRSCVSNMNCTPSQINDWKRQLLDRAAEVFDAGKAPEPLTWPHCMPRPASRHWS